MDLDKSFNGLTLKRLRKSAGYTQEDLGKAIQRSPDFVSNVERENETTVIALSDVFGWWKACSPIATTDIKEGFVAEIVRYFELELWVE